MLWYYNEEKLEESHNWVVGLHIPHSVGEGHMNHELLQVPSTLLSLV